MTLRDAFEAAHIARYGWKPHWIGEAYSDTLSRQRWEWFQLGAEHAARECASEADKLAAMADNPDSVDPDRTSTEWQDYFSLCPESMRRVKDSMMARFPEAFKP